MKTGYFLLIIVTVLLTGNKCEDKEKSLSHPSEPEMISVKGGTFMMGSISGRSNEQPVHRVTVSDFKIAKYEITQAQWQALMGTSIEDKMKEANEINLYGQGGNYPMYYVSWEDCQEFIVRLNVATDKKYRLPTEAEWEYAARGGNKSHGYKYSGSNNVEEIAWCDANSDNMTSPVGTKLPNELGIHDMTGNVLEFCSDFYDDYTCEPQINPKGAASGYKHLIRGGGWNDPVSWITVTVRVGCLPARSGNSLGFRLAMDE